MRALKSAEPEICAHIDLKPGFPVASTPRQNSAAPEKMADDDEPALDLSLKKKKKKKPVADELADDMAAVTVGDDDDDAGELDLTKKKKKKKPKAEDAEEEAPAPAPAPADDDDEDEDLTFSAKKKKKPKAKAAPEPEDDDDGGGATGGGDGDDDDDDDDDGEDDGEEQGFVSIPADREYKYEELLDRMYSLLVANNPELAGDRKRFLMKPPQVVREGSKRVVVINFGDICKTLNRSIDHVYAFMLAEMGTTGSIDASNRMVIKGRFTPKAIEQLIRRYVGEYVTCSSCKSPQTTMQKQNRLYFMQCNNCGARRSVTPIKTGFVAISRGARKKARAP